MTTQPQARPRVETAPESRPVRDLRSTRLPTRPRRVGQWAGTVVFVGASVVLAGWLWQQRGDTVDVLVMGEAVAAGQVISEGDLTSASVSGVPGAIPVADLELVVGATASTGLVPGQVLNEGLLAAAPVPATGQRVVGVELDPTRVPWGITAGDVVSVLAVPPSGDPGDPEVLTDPPVLAENAQVLRVGRGDAGTRISLVVPDAEANQVAAFGAAGRVAIVQAPSASASDGAGR